MYFKLLLFKCDLFKARKEHIISHLCALLPIYLPSDDEDHRNEGHHVYHCTDEEVQVAVPVQTGHVEQQGIVCHRNSKPTHTQNTKRNVLSNTCKQKQTYTENTKRNVLSSKQQKTYTHTKYKEKCVIK